MMNAEKLRKEFDEFLENHGCDMTNDEVLDKAHETEKLLFAAE